MKSADLTRTLSGPQPEQNLVIFFDYDYARDYDCDYEHDCQ